MSDTPRTDKALKANLALGHGSCVVAPEDCSECDPWELARSLERELNEAKGVSYELMRNLWVSVVKIELKNNFDCKASVGHADMILKEYKNRFVDKTVII